MRSGPGDGPAFLLREIGDLDLSMHHEKACVDDMRMPGSDGIQSGARSRIPCPIPGTQMRPSSVRRIPGVSHAQFGATRCAPCPFSCTCDVPHARFRAQRQSECIKTGMGHIFQSRTRMGFSRFPRSENRGKIIISVPCPIPRMQKVSHARFDAQAQPRCIETGMGHIFDCFQRFSDAPDRRRDYASVCRCAMTASLPSMSCSPS